MPLIESYTPSPLGEIRTGTVEATSEQILGFFGETRSGPVRLYISQVKHEGDMVEIIRSNSIDVPMERTTVLFDSERDAYDFYDNLLNCFPELSE